MPYQPKFKTGETAEANGQAEGDGFAGELVIIISTAHDIYKYCKDTSFYVSVSFDNRDACHTMYATYSINRGKAWWYNEIGLEPYCSNVERGRKQLINLNALNIHTREHFGINVPEFIKLLEVLGLYA